MRIPRSRVLATPVPTRTGVVVLAMLVAAVLVGLANDTDQSVEVLDDAGAPAVWEQVRSSRIVGEMRGVRTAPVHDDGGLPLLNVVLATIGLVTIAALLVVRRRSAKRVAARQ